VGLRRLESGFRPRASDDLKLAIIRLFLARFRSLELSHTRNFSATAYQGVSPFPVPGGALIPIRVAEKKQLSVGCASGSGR
jgi:hypothetical protein